MVSSRASGYLLIERLRCSRFGHRARPSSLVAVVIVLLIASLVGCSSGGGYGTQREEYLQALFDHDYESAFALLCPSARARIASPENLGTQFERIVNSYKFTDSWGSLKGEPDLAYTTFFQVDGEGQVTFSLPIRRGKEAEMCPVENSVLGSRQE